MEDPPFPWPQKYNYVFNAEAPDIIGLPDGGVNHYFHEWARYRYALFCRRRHGWRPVLFNITAELHRPFYGADFTFSYEEPAARNNCLYHHILYGKRYRAVFKSLLPGATPDEYRKKLLNAEKKRFCSFIYRDDSGKQVHERQDFCKLLSQYKKVDCPGRVLNNMPRLASGEKPRWEFLASCKFSIAFEHTSSKHYITEKLTDALYAGAVPIYWGSPEAAEYYNPAAFINCHDFKSFEDVMQRVIEVDSNPRLYEQYRNAPSILPESRYYGMMRDVERRCAAMVETALERRNRERTPLRDGFLLCRMVLRNLHLECKHLLLIIYMPLHTKLPWVQRVWKFWKSLRRSGRRSFASD